MRKFLAVSVALGSLFFVGSAQAQDALSWMPSWTNGIYLRGDVGGGWGESNTFVDTAPGTTLGAPTLPVRTGRSVLFGGGIGYRINPLLRADLTVDYLPSLEIKGMTSALTASNLNQASAPLTSLVGMGNVYLQLDGLAPTMFGPLQPYINGGVGVARNRLGTISVDDLPQDNLDGNTKTNFAWGVGAGIAYPLTENLSIDVAYKYLDLGRMTSGSSAVNAFGGFTISQIRSNDLVVNTITAGLRWTFGASAAPPPAMPVAAAPAAPPPAAAVPSKQMFIVFFEFDKSSLTPDGKKVVDAAAAAFKNGRSDVALAGYTDLAGTQQYNLALSHRRADTVKAALVKDGVPASAIGENWYGKQDPRVPTADGVREPQNRRVQITM